MQLVDRDQQIRIADPDDPRIADFRNIRERDLLRDRQTFICEGKTVLNVLVSPQSRFGVKSLLILENRIEGCGSILAQTPTDVPVYVASAEVMDAIAGFPIHRGVLAAAHKTHPQIDLSSARRIVIASAISNHDNVGALFRNAAAFGFDAVLLDDQCCEPLYRKAIRVSVGGVLRVPFAHGGNIETLCAQAQSHGLSSIALATKGDVELAAWKPSARVALLVGSEGKGLPNAILQTLETVTIPMHAGFDSLNVATAAAIAMHHVSATDTR
ncbi:MAG: RNA methyltransferase [Pseudomonadota bacterium]